MTPTGEEAAFVESEAHDAAGFGLLDPPGPRFLATSEAIDKRFSFFETEIRGIHVHDDRTYRIPYSRPAGGRAPHAR